MATGQTLRELEAKNEEQYDKVLKETHLTDHSSAFDNALKQFDRAAKLLELTSNQVAMIKGGKILLTGSARELRESLTNRIIEIHGVGRTADKDKTYSFQEVEDIQSYILLRFF